MAATYESTFFAELVEELPGATADSMKQFFEEFGQVQAKVASGERLSTIEVAQAGAKAQTLGPAFERARAAADAAWLAAGNALDGKANSFRSFVARASADLAFVGKAWTNPDPVMAVRNFGANAAKVFGVIGNSINLMKVAQAESGEELSGAVVGWAGGALGAWAGGAAGVGAVVLLGTNPVGWTALAIIGLGTFVGSIVFSTAGDEAGKHLFREFSDYNAKRLAEQRVAAQINAVEAIYGPDSPTTQMVKARLTDAVDKLGRLDGTWMQAFTDLSSSEKAALTAALKS